MRAVVITEYGGPDVLEVHQLTEPEPGPDEIAVDVVSSALNRADLLQRQGFYPDPDRVAGAVSGPEVPGMEFAGRVARLGSRVTSWTVGDAAMGLVAGGAYAERLCVHARQAMPVPAGVALADAAAIPEVFITAFDALVVQGGLTPGRVALVHAGASGVGTAAIQIAKAIGGRVVVTASAGKLDACRALGADHAVDYRNEDFVTVARAASGDSGVDVVLDVVGGDYLPRNIDAVRIGGRIVQVGAMAGGSVAFNVGALVPKRVHLIGTVLRARPLEEKIAISRRFASEMLPLFSDGRLRPVIDSRFALDQASDAHRRMESNANVGKILLDVK